MKIIHLKKNLIIILSFIIVILNCFSVVGNNNFNQYMKPVSFSEPKSIILQFNFSYPTIIVNNQDIWVYVNETDMNMVIPGKPVLPVNITELSFEFGTEIIDIKYNSSTPEIIEIPGRLVHGLPIKYDLIKDIILKDGIQTLSDIGSKPYPFDWISNHTGGGLSFGEHVSFFVLRVYPIRFFPNEYHLQFIDNIKIEIFYQEPADPILDDNDLYDLLIIANHKNNHKIKTRLVSLEELYEKMYWPGRDNQEKIKYYIKEAIENWGITHVLLVGGIYGQTLMWNLPVRYSHVVPPIEQEYAEPSFISDLYYADIFDSKGNFSSWDSNNNNIFAEWNETYREKMDIYPDVYLGRLPCRNLQEVRVMVRKIVNYEKDRCDKNWFNNLVLVAGDSYNDTDHFNEGELISERAIELMPGFNPIKVYSSEQDINRRTVNKAMNQGAGFAYFCGHGNPMSWTTHFPPEGTEWTTGYKVKDMIFLRNKDKLPITVVGGCHNGRFDVSLMNIIEGIKEDGLHYFSRTPGNAGRFWWNEWSPNCWSWWLTSKIGGGAIACIANTGLGTHGDGDLDNNGIADYLEVLDGWLELRFLQLYGEEQKDILGQNYGETINEYLHRFYGNNAKMDLKMVQQWELFGDPSLKIGGYFKTNNLGS
jgi:hypothetical protein